MDHLDSKPNETYTVPRSSTHGTIIDPVTRHLDRRSHHPATTQGLHRSNSTVPTRYATAGNPGGLGTSVAGYPHHHSQTQRRLNNFFLDEQNLTGTGPLTSLDHPHASPTTSSLPPPHHHHQHHNNNFNLGDNTMFLEDVRSYL